MKPEKQDFSVGRISQWDATVLDDGRIKLPADVLTMLESLKLSTNTLCPGRIPRAKALVLCPEQSWNRWKEHLQSQFPLLKTHRGAAAYLHPFKPIGWDRQGRISLPTAASSYAGIKAGSTVIFLGKEYYLEVWTEEELNRAIKECEDTWCKADLQRSNGQGGGVDLRLRPQGGGTL
jgi:DNA-binding transcriptional regulator/RsmH inhibitor MraZ